MPASVIKSIHTYRHLPVWQPLPVMKMKKILTMIFLDEKCHKMIKEGNVQPRLGTSLPMNRVGNRNRALPSDWSFPAGSSDSPLWKNHCFFSKDVFFCNHLHEIGQRKIPIGGVRFRYEHCVVEAHIFTARNSPILIDYLVHNTKKANMNKFYDFLLNCEM